MSNKSKHHRRKTECKPQVIMACDWCGDAFARQMSDGVFCHAVCRLQAKEQERSNRDDRTISVSETIKLYEDNATE